MEKAMIIIGFILIGVTAGFFTFLILRMGMHQNQFKWAGALSVVTTLAGGGFLTYSSSPVQFASYCLGYFIGVASYICLTFPISEFGLYSYVFPVNPL